MIPSTEIACWEKNSSLLTRFFLRTLIKQMCLRQQTSSFFRSHQIMESIHYFNQNLLFSKTTGEK